MNTFSTLLMAAALTAAGSATATGVFSPNRFNDGVLPVLVQVNASGKVTRVSPSSELQPKYLRLLTKNIQEMVSGPARSRYKAVSSQFVMNVTLKTAPRPDGTYDGHFAYVSASPLPAGALHWLNIDGVRLVLVRDDDTFQQRSPRYYQDSNRSHYAMPYNQPSSSPSFTSPARSPAPAPQRSSGNTGGH